MEEVDKHLDFKTLNIREPKPTMLLRLLTQAQVGAKCEASLVESLEFRRDQYGLNRRDYAALLGLTPGHYSEVCGGKRRLPMGATKRAYAIGVPSDALLQW